MKDCEKLVKSLLFYLNKIIPKYEKKKTSTIPNMHELIVIPKIPLEKRKMVIIGVIAMYVIPSKILRFIINEKQTSPIIV